MLKINEQNYSYFKKVAAPNLAWTGKVASDWAKMVEPSIDSSRLPKKMLTRAELREYCRSGAAREEEAFLACMAWGGMNARWARTAWQERERLIPILSSLRSGYYSRGSAYDLLNEANITGLGPAFFTKIIYFLRPEPDGYILDQWTAKSICLLFEPIFIRFLPAQAESSVHGLCRSNDSNVYELYCEIVEFFSNQFHLEGRKISPDDVETMLFSSGGTRAHAWRQHVKSNWRPVGSSQLVNAAGLNVSTLQ